ncbi:TetR/AcrR family transcriptional regulator [Bacillus sp. JCM 19034]|uniref:TetR/AcrR family transcriptional regulator n=1 Tax=Bacillus sp. JCM 19034 TaxID=1481928 RepID=UPI0009EB561F|nr:TetR/AcrR family transcriptional regulator [Bacillus sp. JCM 19034]
MRKQNAKKILKAAFHVFLRDGYERATMQEIANSAGVGKGTTYEYFESKQSLLFEVVQEAFRFFLKKLVQETEKPGTVREKVERLYECNLFFFQQEVQFRDFMLSDFGKMPEELHDWLREQQGMFIDKLAMVIEEGKEAGELGDHVHPKVAASTLIHSMKVIYFYPATEKETHQEVVKTQVDLLFQGLKKH